MPITLHLLNTNIAEIDSVTSVDIDTALHTSQNVTIKSNFVPKTSRKLMTINTVGTVNIKHLSKKIQRYRKALYKRNLVIRKNRMKKKREKSSAQSNIWNSLTVELSGIQRTIMEMISQNFRHAPQV